MNIKRFALAGGALTTAAAIGFVMQNDPAARHYAQQAAVIPDISGTEADPLEVTDITLTAAVADVPATKADTSEVITDQVMKETSPVAEEEVQVAALGDTPNVDPAPSDAPATVCDVSMTASSIEAAMVDVTLSAPCLPNERVTMHHNGMMFTDVTDADGNLDVTIPALTKNAIFIAAFANGEGALASANVEDLATLDRKVVQSNASAHLHINAFEFGADYREAGHVTAKAERTMSDAANGTGGFITLLGDAAVAEALVAEVYTFPTKSAKSYGDIFVSVEAEVTTDNCGLQVEAQTLEVSEAGRLKVQDLTLPIPACDAVGDFLVLQNLLGDLKVARN